MLRPVADDPIDAVRGALAHLGSDVPGAEAVRAARDADVEAGERA